MPFDPTSLPETARHLIAARDYMQEHGWCQHTGEDSAGRVCWLGALNAVANTFDEWDSLVTRSVEIIGDRNIAGWNDAPGRTYEEVMAAWDRAIALAVEEG